ncbi:MAG: diaminopimelate decarboxylase, partial [Bacteroidetes bacterium]|nr:diaminopimelate decarboxylase [Bacteroidota bacterium]
LIRPALYQAAHQVDVLTSNRPKKTYDVVGPICETSDTFRKGIQLPEVERGDLVAIRSAGAYGEVMSSGFNLRERVKAVYSDVI